MSQTIEHFWFFTECTSLLIKEFCTDYGFVWKCCYMCSVDTSHLVHHDECLNKVQQYNLHQSFNITHPGIVCHAWPTMDHKLFFIFSFSSCAGSDIVQWLLKNLVIEDQGDASFSLMLFCGGWSLTTYCFWWFHIVAVRYNHCILIFIVIFLNKFV